MVLRDQPDDAQSRYTRRRILSLFAHLICFLLPVEMMAEFPRPSAAQDRFFGTGEWNPATPLDPYSVSPVAFRWIDPDGAGSNSATDQDEDDSGADDGDEDNDKVERYMEELFLGFIVYPQEKDELQLTWGLFNGIEGARDGVYFFETEYGITDRFQVGLGLPFHNFEEDSSLDGLRHIELEAYYNFYSNRSTGRAYGVGFEMGLPVAAKGRERNYFYEPFFVAYQEFGNNNAVNFSAALEIEDSLEEDEPVEVGAELTLSVFRKIGKFVPMLELGVELEDERTPTRLAPALYWHPWEKTVDFAISLPIGLNDDTADLGVFFLFILEFEADGPSKTAALPLRRRRG
jgi:hypothetical protein